LATTNDWIECSAARPARRGSCHYEGVRGDCPSGDCFERSGLENKELIALGIAVAVRCDDCIAFHAKAAVEHGATKDEVSETLGTSMGAQVMLSKRSRSSRYQSDPCLDEA